MTKCYQNGIIKYTLYKLFFTRSLAIRFAIFDEKLEVSGLSVDAPKILILDDLLLSLDMSNRDIVLDVVLSQFKTAQLIVMTHDKHFFELTKHKIKRFDPDDWKYFEIYECVKDGIPQPFTTETKSYLEKAEKYFYLHEYEIAGNFLRKEAEAFCEKFLPKKLQYKKDYDLLDLNGLIIKCAEYAVANGLDKNLFDELDRHRKFVLNPTSHDSYDVPKFKSEVAKCLETLQNIRKIKFESVLKPDDVVEFELTSTDGANNYKFEIIIQDDFKLVKEDKKDSVLTSGMINYYVHTNGVKGALQHGKESLKKMYEKNYEKSDKIKSADFWEEVIIQSTVKKLSSIRTF